MELKEITEKMLELLNVKSTEELSDRLFEVVKNNDMTIYEKFCEIVENDLSVDWMQMIFQYYQADRREKMQDYTPKSLASHYLDMSEIDIDHRNYKDIVNDINRVTREKNACKLTLNESLAKGMGFDIDLYKQDQQDVGFNELLAKLGADKLEHQDYFITSKKKNEIKFENNSKEQLSSILIMILQNWKQHIFYLNQEENRYLAELRDALLPELMSGKIDV